MGKALAPATRFAALYSRCTAKVLQLPDYSVLQIAVCFHPACDLKAVVCDGIEAGMMCITASNTV